MSQSNQRAASVFRIPRQPNPHFTGRAALLVEVRETLLRDHAAALTALHGMGGVGKTQLAAEYAYAQRAAYQAVWWLNAETEFTLANDLAALARTLDLPEKDAREIPLIVAASLRWLNSHDGWLLIYDNATDAASLNGYLPQARHGHVLVTSRAPNWRGLAQAVEVKTLTDEDGADFLLERTGQRDEPSVRAAARALSNELGGLPLALEQAGAYCDAQAKPLADYLRLFRQRALELLRRGQPTDYPTTVATTWEISFEAAARECSAAAALLNLLAFCAPEPLPLAVLRENGKKLPDELASTVTDELAFDESLAALRRYSLIAREGDLVALHRLVQLVVRGRLDEATQQHWAAAALRVVNAAFPFESDDVRTWEVCERLLPHAHAVTAFADDWQLESEATARLINQVGAYFLGRAQYAEAKAAFERALRIGEAAFGSDHPKVAIRVNNLGLVLRDLGELAEARQCFERALRIDEAAFGPDHPDVAIDVSNLGIVLQELGELTEARQCLERALRIWMATLGAEHPSTVITRENLAALDEG